MKSFTVRLNVALSLILLSAGLSHAQSQEVQIPPSKDNTLYESSTGATSNGAGTSVFFGVTNQGSVRRGLLAFDVASSVPAGATVESAVLRVVVTKTIAGPTSTTVHRVLQDWGEGTSDAGGNEGGGAGSTTNDATWIHTFFNSQTWQNQGGDYDAGNLTAMLIGGLGVVDYPSTNEFVAAVQAWLDTPSENFGLIIIGNENASPTTKRIGSREGQEANQSLLIVTYAVPTATEKSELPQFLTSLEAYPNPVRGEASIAYELREARNVRIEVVDVTGRLVANPLSQFQPAGAHSVRFDTNELTSGLYLVRLLSSGHAVSRTLVVQ